MARSPHLWRWCARWAFGVLVYGALAIAPPILVAAAVAHRRDRTAVSTTALARPAVQVWQYATFNAEDRVTAICLVLELADSSRVYVPFVDSAFAPVRSVGASCSVSLPVRP